MSWQTAAHPNKNANQAALLAADSSEKLFDFFSIKASLVRSFFFSLLNVICSPSSKTLILAQQEGRLKISKVPSQTLRRLLLCLLYSPTCFKLIEMFSLSSGLCLPVFHLLVFALAATHREKGREENSVNSKSGYGAVQTSLFPCQSVGSASSSYEISDKTKLHSDVFFQFILLSSGLVLVS